MIKRMNKVTSLLVAAAAIVSIVPANAATKLATKEGTIENAVAFEGGKYLYEGYRSDDDDNGLYYNNGGDKDKYIEDATEIVEKFDKNMVAVKDGSDDYVIDMSKGTISDEDTLSDLEETATTKLTNKLKKTDRYGSSVSPVLSRVESDQFGDVWYSYTTTSGFGYTNQSGTYIDCSFDLNAYVYYNATTSNASTGKTYKLEDVKDSVVVDKDNELKAKVTDIKFNKYLGQDDKYIYSLIELKIENAMDIKNNGEYDVVNEGTRYFIQKVSKAQGDKEEDAYKPKTTECYEVTKNFDNSDLEDAYKLIVSNNYETRVVDGNLYVMYREGEKVKVNKILLRTSEKLKVHGSNSATDKISAHVAKNDDDVDTKADDFGFDVNGNVWAIYKGEIKKSSKLSSFETVYTCDRSLNRLDVYDENNLIAWDSEGDVYTTVQEGKDAAKDEAEEIVKPEEVKTGWQSENGAWYLYDATGAKLTGWQNVGGTWYYMDPTTTAMRTGWLNDNGTWYYLQSSGAMKTGWLNDNGTWYYLQSSGAMKTGWLNDNGTWYYLNANGSMAANTTVDGYVLGANGAWIR